MPNVQCPKSKFQSPMSNVKCLIPLEGIRMWLTIFIKWLKDNNFGKKLKNLQNEGGYSKINFTISKSLEWCISRNLIKKEELNTNDE